MNEDQDDRPTIAPDDTPAATNDHDEVMAHFQEITDFYDMDQCLAILESTQWNLDQAIQTFFSGANPTNHMDEDIVPIPDMAATNMHSLPSAPMPGPNHIGFSITDIMGASGSLDPQMQGIYAQGTTIMPQINNGASFLDGLEALAEDNPFSKLKQPNRLINFNIEYFKRKFTLHMPDNETVLSLKELIEQEIDLPVRNQKLKGWKNKDARISDHMQLRDLNLPLENNLFVINTNSKDDASACALYGDNNTKIDSFELDIQVIKTNGPNGQVKIVNNSKSASSSSLAAHLEANTFRAVTAAKESSSYHLHFEPNIKFIEIKRKINMLTSIATNEQEWWLFLTNPTTNRDNKVNSETSLEVMIEDGSLFNMPLTVLIENDMKLIDLKILLDKLTETNTKVGTSSQENSMPGFIPLASSSNCQSNNNSKLTPPVATVLNMAFLVTQKKIDLVSSSDNQLPGKSSSNAFDIIDMLEEDDALCELSASEDDLDENFIMDTTPKHKALIPATCPVGDEVVGTTMFIEEFFKRYQPLIPVFFNGPLEDAIKEALLCSARDRKLLGIYLHSDNSVCRHIFCSKTLCDENIVNFLAANFVVWPWDLTHKQNEAHFYSTCSKYLGSVVTSHLRTNKIEFPAFLVVNRTRATNEVVAVIEGTASPDSMLNRLMQAFEMFEGQRVTDMRDENERGEREQIKSDQDAAYRESLELDKAKRQKQDEEQDRLKKAEREEQDLEQRKIKEREQKIKSSMDRLPAEPAKDSPANKVSMIRFRLPNGELLQRKFFIDNKLESLFDYLTSNGYFIDEFKVLSIYPRRDLTAETTTRTLEDFKLFPQETLTLEER